MSSRLCVDIFILWYVIIEGTHGEKKNLIKTNLGLEFVIYLSPLPNCFVVHFYMSYYKMFGLFLQATQTIKPISQL